MALLATVVTTASGALSATIGVVVGATFARRAQDRHWLRDRQLVAYQDLLREYATFSMIRRRAHLGGTIGDYDWGRWSAALMSASLIAPVAVANEIDKFGHTVNGFLKATAGLEPTATLLTRDQFEQTMVGPALAQVALVNAMRRSLGKDEGPLATWLGGAMGDPSHWKTSDVDR